MASPREVTALSTAAAIFSPNWRVDDGGDKPAETTANERIIYSTLFIQIKLYVYPAYPVEIGTIVLGFLCYLARCDLDVRVLAVGLQPCVGRRRGQHVLGPRPLHAAT